MELILSLFPGIDLLGMAFERAGFCVVRGPDLIWGQSIEGFHVPAGRFNGVIAGSPCQDFSTINRNRDTAKGDWALAQFTRVVTECQPEWFLLENVPTVSSLIVEGFSIQRFDLSARECGLTQLRRRHFQFGSRIGLRLAVERRAPVSHVSLQPAALASEGRRKHRRSFADFCGLQGLPHGFDLPGWPIAFKYRAVGNGVPIPMGESIARAIVTARCRTPLEQSQLRLCDCDCGRQVSGRRVTATAACRKRMQRKRDAVRANNTGVVTLIGDALGEANAWRVTSSAPVDESNCARP